MRTFPTLLAAAALAASTGLALAQEASDHSAMEGMMEGMDHSGIMEGMEHSGADVSAAMGNFFMTAMDTMMQTMPMESSGNVDADFLLMMIPHHQSAIDMARVELEQGQDEETRALAQAVIDAQEAEIAEMRAMLERMGVEPPPATTE